MILLVHQLAFQEAPGPVSGFGVCGGVFGELALHASNSARSEIGGWSIHILPSGGHR